MPVWYANPDPRFQPAMRLISDITRGPKTTITTSFDHDYESGLVVRLYVPDYYGMSQIDRLTGAISVLSSDTFSIDLDSSLFDPFSVPSSPPYYNKTATVVPVGNELGINYLGVRNVSGDT